MDKLESGRLTNNITLFHESRENRMNQISHSRYSNWCNTVTAFLLAILIPVFPNLPGFQHTIVFSQDWNTKHTSYLTSADRLFFLLLIYELYFEYQIPVESFTWNPTTYKDVIRILSQKNV